MKSSFVIANGIRFHLVEDGPADGPLVVLLHGFPEFWYSWRHQLPELAARGLHVVAPDLRGYNLSEKPAGIESYAIDRLSADVVALIQSFGAARAAVVGHDWGGAVAWHTAMFHPERVSKLAVLACPHPWLMARELLRNPRQTLRSWYMFFFQLPLVPELLLSSGAMRRWLQGWTGRVEAFTDDDVDRYVEAAEQPGAMRSAINYYRAALRWMPKLLDQTPPKVLAPTLLVWGAEDRILGQELTRDLDRFVAAQSRLEMVEEAGHFVQQEAPSQVTRLLVDFLVEPKAVASDQTS